MTLGIKSVWRVRPRVSRPLSLIPGDRSSVLPRPKTSITASTASATTSAASHSRVSSSSSEPQPTAATSPDRLHEATNCQTAQNVQHHTKTAARHVASRHETSAQPHLEPPSPSDSAAPSFIQRLAGVPVRRHGPRRSVLIEAPTAYPHKLERRRTMTRNHRATTRQRVLERIRMSKNAPVPDWRLVLSNLTHWTPDYTGQSAGEPIKIVFSRDSAELLLTDGQHNLWDIKARTACDMQLYEGGCGQSNEAKSPPYLLLSGQKRAVGAAVQEILNVCKSATVTSVVSNREATAANAVESSDALVAIPARKPHLSLLQPYNVSVGAQDLPRPGTWTTRSLEAYVASLVRSRLSPELAARVYRQRSSHPEAVIAQLHRVLKDAATRPILSCAAFKMALQYMVRQGLTHRPDARALYARMEIAGLKMDPDVYNILAEAAVHSKDLLFFSTVLGLMHRRGHPPNLRTWILFLRMIEAEEVKRYILHAIDRKGLLGAPNAVKLVSLELANADVERAIQQGKTLGAFLAEQEDLYGPEWLTTASLHKVLEVLGRHSRLDDALAVVDLMLAQRSCSPNALTLNILLTHCKVQNDLYGALRVLQRLGKSVAALADSTTYHLLFELAWRHKMPHALGLIWRHACAANSTSYRMRRRITVMLHGSKGSSRLARRINLGTSRDGSAAQDLISTRLRLDSEASSLFLHEFLSFYGSKEATKMLEGNWAAAQVIADWYRTQYKDHAPASSLADLLGTALERDDLVQRDAKEGRRASLAFVEMPMVPTQKFSAAQANKATKIVPGSTLRAP